MTEEKYTAEQLEQMADQLLQEAAPAQEKPAKGGLDEKTIASLPAAALLWVSAALTIYSGYRYLANNWECIGDNW